MKIAERQVELHSLRLTSEAFLWEATLKQLFETVTQCLMSKELQKQVVPPLYFRRGRVGGRVVGVVHNGYLNESGFPC